MPIATIGAVVRVTPRDDVQIIQGENDHEFVDDKTPFRVKVEGIIWEEGALIGVFGPVIDGHSGYHGLIATLLTRSDNSQWETDVRSAVNFKLGSTVARRVPGFPHRHPEGTVLDGFPKIVRYGTIEAG